MTHNVAGRLREEKKKKKKKGKKEMKEKICVGFI